MKFAVLSKKIMLVTLACIVVSPMATAKTMYRWKDENGKWIFSDQVPPSQIQHEREALDKNAQVIKVIEKPKTKDQIELERRLNELKQQQEKIIAAQKTHDKMLLSSFLDVKTMIASHNSKIQALDSQDKDRRAAIKKLEEDITRQHKEAADLERGNKKVPPEMLSAIEENQKKIAVLNAEIKEIQERKARITKDFAIDKERFIFLTQSKGSPDTTASVPANADKALNQLGLFTCDTADLCEKAWSVAKNFVKANSTTKLNVETEKLLMTNDPVLATDLSLSVSKMPVEGTKQQIFLDIRCVETVQGKEVCANPKAESLRSQFSEYVRSALGVSTSKPSETPTASAPAKK